MNSRSPYWTTISSPTSPDHVHGFTRHDPLNPDLVVTWMSVTAKRMRGVTATGSAGAGGVAAAWNSSGMRNHAGGLGSRCGGWRERLAPPEERQVPGPDVHSQCRAMLLPITATKACALSGWFTSQHCFEGGNGLHQFVREFSATGCRGSDRKKPRASGAILSTGTPAV